MVPKRPPKSSPAANGYVGILPGHAALLAELHVGKLSFTAAGERRSLTVSGGWLEVADDHVRVLADGAGDAAYDSRQAPVAGRPPGRPGFDYNGRASAGRWP